VEGGMLWRNGRDGKALRYVAGERHHQVAAYEHIFTWLSYSYVVWGYFLINKPKRGPLIIAGAVPGINACKMLCLYACCLHNS
jgi:hypothetical protein